eukprot:CAMPEP_0113564186 /NCGR_PEP_ID=MMETSP0015_2-20120614/21477_1 /TAXON_ID=2838 /ORGANISM="Odontella" /LENGTH=30 /DNA_ID=CAMNT_0000466235 /DNA_START=9 /DNA_END=101 /DNA_ORIENTATION=+ /assembly_acc=CAM_ASM_000160
MSMSMSSLRPRERHGTAALSAALRLSSLPY